MIELGKKLNLTIIVEGVENEAQRHYLLQKGVTYGQGWLFSRALPFEEFERLLRRNGN